MSRAIALFSGSAAGLLPRPLIAFFRDLVHELFATYHPERHYMRGPGPACAKTGRPKA